MTTASDLEALALRVEREEPSRELEREVFRAVGMTPEAERHCVEWCKMDGRTDLTRDRYISAWAPRYCSSLDAAASLEKPEHSVSIDKIVGDRVYVSIRTGYLVLVADSCAPTEPRARTAAALRAMAQEDRDE